MVTFLSKQFVNEELIISIGAQLFKEQFLNVRNLA